MYNVLLFGYYARFIRPLLPVAREAGGDTFVYMPVIEKPDSPVSAAAQNTHLPEDTKFWIKRVGTPGEAYDPDLLAQTVMDNKIDVVLLSDVVWQPCRKVREDLTNRGVITPVIGRPHGLPFDIDVGFIDPRAQDRVACWGGYQKRVLSRIGFPALDLVGNPEYDDLWNTWVGGKYVLFCAESSDKATVWAMLEEIRQELPGVPILIKEHPELPGEWQRFLGTGVEGYVFPNPEVENDVYKLIQNSMLTVTVSSTCGFDAWVIGAPAFYLGGLTWKTETVWGRSGLVAKRGEVGKMARYVVDNNPRNISYLYDLATGPGATQRMLKSIDRCLNAS